MHSIDKRISIFFSSASLVGAFSGLLAAAVAQMHGVGNRPGWAWIFILVNRQFLISFQLTIMTTGRIIDNILWGIIFLSVATLYR
jgi:hypothetical protein